MKERTNRRGEPLQKCRNTVCACTGFCKYSAREWAELKGRREQQRVFQKAAIRRDRAKSNGIEGEKQ